MAKLNTSQHGKSGKLLILQLCCQPIVVTSL